MDGLFVLADGTVFEGEAYSGDIATGEVVVNTVLSGYQEVITDPYYWPQSLSGSDRMRCWPRWAARPP
jgi:carbamoyl-phosphate synthase small subunit